LTERAFWPFTAKLETDIDPPWRVAKSGYCRWSQLRKPVRVREIQGIAYGRLPGVVGAEDNAKAPGKRAGELFSGSGSTPSDLNGAQIHAYLALAPLCSSPKRTGPIDIF
jgi:hypothetical protein